MSTDSQGPTATEWFDDIPVIAAYDERALAKTMWELEEEEEVSFGPPSIEGLFGPKAYQHSQHAFGYIPPLADVSAGPLEIQHAGTIEADRQGLQGKQIKVTLDRVMIADYPGRGKHHVLLDFYAQNHLKDQTEHLHFNQVVRGQEEQMVGVIGYPIFVGINVGNEGISFKCFTVNVKNDDDEAILAFLDSDVARTGLKLAQTAQPALAPLANMAVGLTKALAQRRRNVPVQDFYMGLDFAQTATGARLREGSYIAVQTPELWDWSQWIYDPQTGRVVKREAPGQLIPYNYIIFGVSKYESPS